MQELLTRERLLTDAAVTQSYATPRRLAVLLQGILEKQQDSEEQLTGPSWKVAFRDGEPTPAALAFAKKAGVEVTALTKLLKQSIRQLPLAGMPANALHHA